MEVAAKVDQSDLAAQRDWEAATGRTVGVADQEHAARELAGRVIARQPIGAALGELCRQISGVDV